MAVKNLKAIKVKCIGPLPGLTLDETSQGRLSATLTLGTGAGRYCVEFDAPKTDQPGLFKGAQSPAPASCS